MPVPMPDFGIDPSLLVAPSQPPPSPMDPLAAAIAALQASGQQFGPPVPSLYGTGNADTNLEPLPPQPHPSDPYASQPTAQYDASGHQIHGHQLPDGAVTITSQQRTPSKAEAAARSRAEAIADPDTTLAPDDVMGQSARETMSLNAAGDAHARQAQYEYKAAQDQAGRLAAAHQQAAADQQQLNEQYQVARQAAEAKADMDTAAWLQDLQAKAAQEPNTHRWFDSQPLVGKALWGLSLLFGAGSAALTPGSRNVILDMVRQNMADDVALQRERLDKEMAALKTKGAVMEKRSLRNLTDMTDDHTMALGRLQSLQQAYIARAMAPGAADLQAGLAGADAWFGEQTLKIASSRREQAVQMEGAKLQRSFQAGQNQLDRTLEWNKQSRELAKDYDLAKLSADAAAGAGDAHKGEVRISPEAGALVVDKTTGKPVGEAGDEGALYINEKMEPAKVQATISAASQEAADLQSLYTAMTDDSSFAGIVAGTNVEAQQALARLQQSRVAGQGGLGHTTDRDMDVIVQNIQGMGTGGVVDRTKLAMTRSQVSKAIERTISSHKLEVDNKLAPYAPKGTKIDWSPRNVTPPPVHSMTPDEQIAQLGGTPQERHLARNPDELKQMRDRGEDPRLTGASAAGQYAPILQNLEADIPGSSAAHIRKLAEAALQAVAPGDQWAVSPTGEAPKPGSEFARDAYIPSVVQPAIEKAEKAEKALVGAMVTKAYGEGFKQQMNSSIGSKERWKTHAPVVPDRKAIENYAKTEFGFTNLTPEDLDRLQDEVDEALGKKRKN